MDLALETCHPAGGWRSAGKYEFMGQQGRSTNGVPPRPSTISAIVSTFCSGQGNGLVKLS